MQSQYHPDPALPQTPVSLERPGLISPSRPANHFSPACPGDRRRAWHTFLGGSTGGPLSQSIPMTLDSFGTLSVAGSSDFFSKCRFQVINPFAGSADIIMRGRRKWRTCFGIPFSGPPTMIGLSRLPSIAVAGCLRSPETPPPRDLR